MLTQRLRHRVTIQEQVQTQDPNLGSVVVTWQDFLADEAAEVVPLSGREFIQSAEKQGAVDARMTLRYNAGIVPSMRVVFDGDNYNIAAILPDASARRWLTLMVTRGPSDGD